MAGRGRRAQWLSVALLATTAAAAAAPPPAAPPTAASTADTQAQADLLLFLSEFEDAAGGFVDPTELPPATAEPAPEDDDDAR